MSWGVRRLTMTLTMWRFLATFGMNLLAAYVPSLFCMAAMRPDSSWAYLWSPVCLAVLMLGTFSLAVQLVVLGAFLASVLALSLLCRIAKARCVLAGWIFIVCFVQGLLSAGVISGIDAIGRS
ncbi:unnamed protein product [uncultured bacterium]|nr:unnamed protein product [uncultured bacterium]